jgi:hypothetical protein
MFQRNVLSYPEHGSNSVLLAAGIHVQTGRHDVTSQRTLIFIFCIYQRGPLQTNYT